MKKETNMKRRMRSVLLVVTLAVSVALSGCSGDKKTTESATENELSKNPVEGGSIKVGISQDLDSLDPHKAVAAGTKEVLFNIFEGLVKPDIWEFSEVVVLPGDFRGCESVYIYLRRRNFHNGNEVTAEDVKYSIERCADTSNGDPLVSAYSIIESVNILDENTVEIRLTEPDTEFLSYMTTAIIPKDNADLETNPIGTGPFRYVSRSPQENVILAKNEDYWGEKAHLDQVEFKIVSDADMLVTNLKGGSIDMAMRLTTNSKVAQPSDLWIPYGKEGTMNLVQALYLNNEAEPLNNEKVRQALCYAIDPDEIMAMMADGKGVRVGTSMYPGLKKYYDESYATYYEQDYEKAKKLLKEAGYPDGFDLEITVSSADQPHIDTAQVIVEELKNIGVNATIKPIGMGDLAGRSLCQPGF